MNNLSVLIIDDASLVRERIEHLLKENNSFCKIFHAGSCAEGIILLDKEKPDVAILDLNLPDYNGIKLLQFIKSKFPQTKTIILSNHSFEHYKNACKALGAVDFIDKSLEFEKIVPLVSSLQLGVA